MTGEFRVWDVTNKKMWLPENANKELVFWMIGQNGILEKVTFKPMSDTYVRKSFEGAVPQFWTGETIRATDIDDIRIYDGDILSWNPLGAEDLEDGYPYQVKWSEGTGPHIGSGWHLWLRGESDFIHLSKALHGWPGASWSKPILIGNISENPELLSA